LDEKLPDVQELTRRKNDYESQTRHREESQIRIVQVAGWKVVQMDVDGSFSIVGVKTYN
jgi:hypothetical protein